MITFHKVLILALLAASVGSAQPTDPKADKEPFSISIVPMDNDLRTGAEVFVKVRIVNNSKNGTVSRGGFYAQGVDTAFQYDCRNAAGKYVNKEIFPVGSIGDAPPLGPGESYEETVPVSRACDLSHPGQYQIQISKRILGDPQHRVVKSNTVKITVIR